MNDALDYVAPVDERSNIERFEHHWKCVQEEHSRLVKVSHDTYERAMLEEEMQKKGEDAEQLERQRYTDAEIDAQLIRSSSIREHLEEMITILRDEDSHRREGEDVEVETEGSISGGKPRRRPLRSHGAVRPCLEFALEARFVEVICAMSLADRPRGMTALVLQVLKLLLHHVSHPLLIHVSVYRPLCHLVHVCKEARSSKQPRNVGTGIIATTKMQASLVAFLEVLWRRIELDPATLDFFYERREAEQEDSTDRKDFKLPIFNALVPYVHASKRTGERARTALLTAISLKDGQLIHYIVHNSLLTRRLAEGLASAYAALPEKLSSGDDAPAARAMAEYRRRLQYCNAISVAAKAHECGMPLVMLQCREFLKRFLRPSIGKALLSISESAQCAAAAYVRETVLVLSDAPMSPFTQLLIRFLLGEATAPEVSVGSASNEKMPVEEKVRATLVHRINSQASAVSERTLELFSALLDSADAFVLHNLILRNLGCELRAAEHPAPPPASPVEAADADADTDENPSVAPSTPSSSSAAQAARGKLAAATSPVTPLGLASRSLGTPRTPVTPITTATPDAARFLNEIPGSPRPKAGESSTPSVFDEYLADAHTQSFTRLVSLWDSMAHAHGTHSAGVDESTVDIADGGSFLSGVFDKLECMLDNTFDENIILTEVLSKLAQSPHGALHMYLFAEGGERRSLVSVLKQTWTEALERSERIKNFDRRIEAMRQSLGAHRGDADAESMPIYDDGASEEDKAFIKNYIILDEFLKETAAILQARKEIFGGTL